MAALSFKSFWFVLCLVIVAGGLLAFLLTRFINKCKQNRLKYNKEDQNSLYDERNQLRILIDNMPDFIYIKDLQSRFIVGNKKTAAVMGTEPKDLIGKTDFDFYSQDLAKGYYSDEQNIIKSGKPKLTYEEPCHDENGNTIIISTSKIPVKNKKGEVIGLVGIGRDITDLKEIEKELRKKTDDLLNMNTLIEERQKHIEEQAEKLTEQKGQLLERTKSLEDANQKLNKLNDQLKELNSTKDRLFSIIAHDLKNPFSTILGFSKLLDIKYDRLTKEKKLKYAHAIYNSSKNIYNLLENLLQWARVQSNRIAFEPTTFNLKQLVEQNVSLLKENITKKNMTVEYKSTDYYDVYADLNMINTIIRNLLSNSIKFTPENGKIMISCSKNDNIVEFSITDNGIGMSKEEMDKLFRIDVHFSKSRSVGEEGSGIGLMLCKDLVERNWGKIWVESELNKGSTFHFTLKASDK